MCKRCCIWVRLKNTIMTLYQLLKDSCPVHWNRTEQAARKLSCENLWYELIRLTMHNGTVAISPFASALKNKISYLYKTFKKFTYFSKEGDSTHWSWVSSKRLKDIWIILVSLYGKQTLCCGTIANTDQHLYWIKNFKNMISIIIRIYQRTSRMRHVVKPRSIAMLKPMI